MTNAFIIIGGIPPNKILNKSFLTNLPIKYVSIHAISVANVPKITSY